MRIKTTKKEILRQGGKIIKIGYCGIQSLLNYENARAYTCGTYGWNADIYEVDNITIVTGYRPFGDEVDYNITQEYEKKAEKIVHNYDISHEERKAQVKQLLKEFIKGVK